MNYKGLLQEYLHKKNFNLPKYITKKVNNNFYSIIYINNEQFVDNNFFINKKKAEQSIAKIVYNKLKEKDEDNKIEINLSNKKTCIFVDIENKPNILNEIIEKINIKFEKFNTNIDFYICYSANCKIDFSKYINNNNINKIFKFYKTNSLYKDAADVGLIYLSGKLSHKYKNIGIITSDHFSYSLVEIIKENNKNKNVKLLNNIDEIILFLREISF